MRVFVTGATGFIGSAVVKELIGAGHEITGLVRSDANAKLLAAAGGKVHRGDLENLESLKSGAAASDAVIHLAFIHDFTNYTANCEIDRRAIEAMGSVLAGSDRPLIVTSGLALLAPGRIATEEDQAAPGFPRVSEAAVFGLGGVCGMAIRLAPSVHGDGDKGFIPILINLAREKGVSAYVGDGRNRWPGVHRLDSATLYRLALEKGAAGKCYHGVADEGVPFREIAEVIGRRLDVPIVSKPIEEAGTHFGWFGMFAGADIPTSSRRTQEELGWQPKQPGLIADIDRPSYFRI